MKKNCDKIKITHFLLFIVGLLVWIFIFTQKVKLSIINIIDLHRYAQIFSNFDILEVPSLNTTNY